MKKISKRLLALTLAAVMVLGMAVYTIAEGNEPTVIFDASTKTFEFKNMEKYMQTSTAAADDLPKGHKGEHACFDLFRDIKNAMPGDTFTQKIKVVVENAGSDTVKIMLKYLTHNEDYATLMGLDTSIPEDPYDPDALSTESKPHGTLTVEFEDFDGKKCSYDGKLAKDKDGNAEGVYLGGYTGAFSSRDIDVTFEIPLEAGNELAALTAEVEWLFTAEIIPYEGSGTVIPPTPVPGGGKPELDTINHFAYIIGRTDGLVHPEAEITRAEVATIFFRMLTDESRNEYWSTSNPYPDIAPNDWCNNAISTMTKAGVIQGYTDGYFRPRDSITRAEFATMAVRFFQVVYEGEDLFKDIDEHWARDYINRAGYANIIQGYEDGTFHPDRNISRAEAVTIVNRVLGRKPDRDNLLPNMITWPDNLDEDAWYYADMQEATNSHEYDMLGEGDEQYESWTEIKPVRDWAAFEKEWADANAAANPGEVVTGTPATKEDDQ